jgi:hypothetical protein
MSYPLLRNLLSVLNVLDPATVVESNIQQLNQIVNYLVPDSTTAAGAPTTGIHNQYERWMDMNFAVWVCTVAGTPGTWAQFTPGIGGGGVDGGSF